MSISIDRKRVSIYVCGEHEQRQPDVHEIYDRFIWWSILTRTNYLLEEFRIILYEGIGNSYDIAVTPVLMDRYLCYGYLQPVRAVVLALLSFEHGPEVVTGRWWSQRWRLWRRWRR
jgi:hypothetical protein